MTKEVLMTQPGSLAEMPMSVADMQADAELGGKVTLADIAVPYLYILQGLSPQVNTDHDRYIKDAKPGMLYLTNLELVFEGRDIGLTVVPCYYERLVTEWLPRESGGGLVASHIPDSPAVTNYATDEKGRNFLTNGHQIIDTAYHYFLVQHPETKVWYQAIAPFKSTALKASRRMNSTINTTMIPGTNTRAPRFMNSWQLTTRKEQKNSYVWSSPSLELKGMVSADVYAAAKAFAIVAAKGLLRRSSTEADMETAAAAKPKKQVNLDDDIPF